MRKTPIAISTALALTLAGGASAQMISVNFEGAGHETGDTGAVDAAQVIGHAVHAKPNWNNAGGGSGTLDAGTIVDENALAMPGFSVKWTSPNGGWSTGDFKGKDDNSDNSDMFDGYIESGPGAPLYIDLRDVPYSAYDLVVYMTRDGKDAAAGGLTIDNGGPSTLWYRPDIIEGDPPTLGFLDRWTQATSHDLLTPTDGANFAIYTGLTASSLRLAAVTIGGNKGAAICGVQIMNKGNLIVPPTVAIGDPSVDQTLTGPVDFPISYQFATSVNLTAADVSLVPSIGTVAGTVSILNGTTNTPTVRISGITGQGVMSIVLSGGTASNAYGSAGSAGPSAVVTVGTPVPPPSGPAESGLTVWWDASDLNANGDNNAGWTDGTTVGAGPGSGYFAGKALNIDGFARWGGGPTYVASGANGKPVLRFDETVGAGVGLAMSQAGTVVGVGDSQTLFWVINENADSTGGPHFLGGAGGTYHFHRSGPGFGAPIWSSTYASGSILNGATTIDGVPVDGTTTAVPSDLSIIAVEGTANDIYISRFASDRGIAGRLWDGDVAEILVYTGPLSYLDVQNTGAYLADKWDIAGSTYFAFDPNLPVCALLSHGDGDTAWTGQAVEVKASAVPVAPNTVANVEFFANFESIGVDSTPDGDGNYSVMWTPPANGPYTVMARATDSAGQKNNSVLITVSAISAYHVAPVAAGDGSGSDWANPMTLVDAINAVNLAPGTAGPVYFRGGTYVTPGPLDLTNTIEMYGGFAGTELTPDQRAADFMTSNPTIISGNNTHGIFSSGAAISLTMDGLVLRDGNNLASGGGALYLPNNNAIAIITNCHFLNNTSEGHGGALFLGQDAGPSTVTDCVIDGNTANNGRGGGVYLDDNNAVLTNCTITNNTCAFEGGGFSAYHTVGELYGCYIAGNTATDNDWGRGGGLWFQYYGVPIVEDCIIMNNTANNEGGGLFIQTEQQGWVANSVIAGNVAARTDVRGGGAYLQDSGQMALINNTFIGNDHTGGTGDGVRKPGGGVIFLANSIFSGHAENAIEAGDGVTCENCLLENNPTENKYVGTTPVAMVTGDPMFIDAAGGNYDILVGSAAIDGGNTTTYTTSWGYAFSAPANDILGRPRRDAPDIGAYEQTDVAAARNWELYSE